MIWKHELNVDDNNAAKDFKKEILQIDPNIVVNVTKGREGQFLVKSSLQKVSGSLENKTQVARELKNLYEKWRQKPMHKFESVKKSKLRMLVEKVIKEESPMKEMTARVGHNYLFKYYHRQLDYLSEPLKTNKGNKMIEIETNNKDLLNQLKNWGENNGIGVIEGKFNKNKLAFIFKK